MWVHEVDAESVLSTCYRARDRFEAVQDERHRPWTGLLIEEPTFRVDGCIVPHGTPCLAYGLAVQAAVERLVLIHLSDRYTSGEWLELLSEVREEFFRAEFPPHWDLSADSGKFELH